MMSCRGWILLSLTAYFVSMVEICHGFTNNMHQPRGVSKLVATSRRSSQQDPKIWELTVSPPRIPNGHQTGRSSFILLSSESISNNPDESKSSNDDDAESIELLIAKRQTQVQIGYQATGMIYAIVSMLHLVWKGVNFWSLYYILGGSALLSGMAFLLKEAAVADSQPVPNGSDRWEEISLKSNTYKRMNWMLMGHALLTLTMSMVDPNHFLIPFFIVPSLSALWNAGKGYVYGGVIGWNPTRHICAVFTDIHQGWIQSTKPILQRIQGKSLIYMMLGAMVGLMTMIKLKEVGVYFMAGIAGSPSYSPVALASRISRLARLMLLSGLAFTLKDGADRNMLNQTPFRQLNVLMSAAMASLTGYLWSPGIRIVSTSFALGAASLIFAGITGYHSVRGASRKSMNASP